MWVLLIIATLYLVFGALTAWFVMCAVAPDVDDEERAEAAAVLGVFAGIFWPFVLLLLACGAVFCRDDCSDDDDDTEIEEEA